VPVKSGIKQNPGVNCELIWQRRNSVVRIQIDENWVTLTPFGSLIRINSGKRTVVAKSWAARLRAVFVLLFS